MFISLENQPLIFTSVRKLARTLHVFSFFFDIPPDSAALAYPVRMQMS